MYDVVIVGCGITGAALAFQLARYQLQVAVLEAENDVAQGATKANSAILHAGYDPKPGSLMARLNVEGAVLAKQLCAALDVPWRQNGSLVLGFGQKDAPVLQELYERGRANGVRVELLSGAQVRQMEPGLAPEVSGALYAPDAATCLPWEYCLALAETAVKNGVQLFLSHPVTGLSKTQDGWQVKTPGRTFETRFVVSTAGVQAAAVHEMAAPCPYRIQPTRGEYYLMDKSEGTRVERVIFQCPDEKGKGVLVAPTVHGNLIVGPNAQPVEGQNTANTAAGMAQVRAAAVRSVPGIDFRQSIRNFAGVRAVADTGDFVIGPVEGAPGFFEAAGICSPGLTAAPAIARLLCEQLGQAGLELKEKPDFDGSRKRVRFAALDPQQKAALVARTPAYGRVICRCETVTEGEILDAIRGLIPPCSVDGVKRRVGAGLGRCQGGFCGPRVVELLCRERGLQPDQVLQDRAGSGMLVCQTKGGGANV